MTDDSTIDIPTAPRTEPRLAREQPSCNPTVQSVAKSLWRDPMGDMVVPGKCRVCGHRFTNAWLSTQTKHGQTFSSPISACDRASQLYEKAVELRDAMSEARKKMRASQRDPEASQRRREDLERQAMNALGYDPDLSPGFGGKDDLRGDW